MDLITSALIPHLQGSVEHGVICYFQDTAEKIDPMTFWPSR